MSGRLLGTRQEVFDSPCVLAGHHSICSPRRCSPHELSGERGCGRAGYLIWHLISLRDMHKFGDLNFRTTKTKFYTLRPHSVWGALAAQYPDLWIQNTRCCSKGSESKLGKNVHLGTSNCSSATERAGQTVEKKGGREAFQSEAETEGKCRDSGWRAPWLPQDHRQGDTAQLSGKTRSD